MVKISDKLPSDLSSIIQLPIENNLFVEASRNIVFNTNLLAQRPKTIFGKSYEITLINGEKKSKFIPKPQSIGTDLTPQSLEHRLKHESSANGVDQQSVLEEKKILQKITNRPTLFAKRDKYQELDNEWSGFGDIKPGLRDFFGTKNSLKQELSEIQIPTVDFQDEAANLDKASSPSVQLSGGFRRSSRTMVKKISYKPSPIEDIFNDDDLDADLISIVPNDAFHSKDRDDLRDIIEHKSKTRLLNDELEMIQQRTTSIETIRPHSSKRHVISDDESDVHSSLLPSTSDLSDKEDQSIMNSKEYSHNIKKPKPISFFSEGVPKIETMNIEVVAIGEKRPFSYFQMLNRKAADSVQHPEFNVHGEENCLLGLTFVFTGNFSKLSREEILDLAKRYGGKVTTAPSGKTSFLVVGDEPGAGKMDKAKQLRLSLLNEEQFYKLIRTMPKRSEDGHIDTCKSNAKNVSLKPLQQKTEPLISKKIYTENNTSLWTVKYTPKDITELIGNNSQIQKLRQWLQEWKKRGSSGASFKAALISGPPGIGKTTAANLVSKIEGFIAVEFNASDTRSKKNLKNEIQSILDNRSMQVSSSVSGSNGAFKKILLIMDEVDGMSAGDRGGMAELITFLKKTRIPIICICNDRSSIKVRSLANYCLDIRFRRPDSRQIAPRIIEICYKEDLSLSPNIIDQLVLSTHGDIRQLLNVLSTWKLTKESLSYDEVKSFSELSKKDTEKSSFDVIGELLSRGSFTAKTVNQLLELYFVDSSLIPLMIHENYVSCKPTLPKTKSQKESDLLILEKLSMAADSISTSDVVDTRIHGPNQHWTLAPFHGFLACIVPAFYCSGSLGGRIEFASWLGQNSKSTKNNRLITELSVHLSLHVTGGKSNLRQYYLPALIYLMASYLIYKGLSGVDDVLSYLNQYTISKEDYEVIMELGVGKYDVSVISGRIPSNVKSTLTRQYNKETHKMPYALSDIKKSASLAASSLQDETHYIEIGDDEPPLDEDEEKNRSVDLAKDKMIKPKISKSKSLSTEKSKHPPKSNSASKKSLSKTKTAKPYDDKDDFVVSDDEF